MEKDLIGPNIEKKEVDDGETSLGETMMNENDIDFNVKNMKLIKKETDIKKLNSMMLIDSSINPKFLGNVTDLVSNMEDRDSVDFKH